MIKAIAIGASFGGIEAIKSILLQLPGNTGVSVFIVLHIGNHSINSFVRYLNLNSPFRVTEANDKKEIVANTVYFAPPNYHLQVEDKTQLSLSTDEKINFSRPSIDVLFETAAWAYKDELLGILLTGSNSDGAEGLKKIKESGGTTIVQNPETAIARVMPASAIRLSPPDFILDLEAIPLKVTELIKNNS